MRIMNVAIVLAIVFATANAVPYSKFGRSCQDIGCRSDERCVMAEQPCNYGRDDQCGRYPTCQRINVGGESCTTKICPSGQYCRTENGRPTCVNTNAGLAEDLNKRQEDNSDPKPSAPLLDNMGYPDSKTTQRPAAAYPNYPSSSNSGYPSYPNSQKPASPNLDRYGYPVQSQPVGSYPGYPSSGSSGYPSSNNNYGYPGYPSQDSSRRQSATTNSAGYPSYPNQGGSGGYPSQFGYPGQNPYGGYRQQSGPYQGGHYPQQQNGYNNQGYDPYGPPTTKKPSFTDRIANYAKNVAKQVITQAIIDKVSGRS